MPPCRFITTQPQGLLLHFPHHQDCSRVVARKGAPISTCTRIYVVHTSMSGSFTFGRSSQLPHKVGRYHRAWHRILVDMNHAQRNMPEHGTSPPLPQPNGLNVSGGLWAGSTQQRHQHRPQKACTNPLRTSLAGNGKTVRSTPFTQDKYTPIPGEKSTSPLLGKCLLANSVLLPKPEVTPSVSAPSGNRHRKTSAAGVHTGCFTTPERASASTVHGYEQAGASARPISLLDRVFAGQTMS